jgi:hypothetical protein
MYAAWRLAKQSSLKCDLTYHPLSHLQNWSTSSEADNDTLRLCQFLDTLPSSFPAPTRLSIAPGRHRLVKHGVSLLPAEMDDVQDVERIIYDELMHGVVKRDSERTLKTIITEIDQQGIKAVVLGCTELSMLVDTKANVLPIYDSTEMHADAGVDWILGDALGDAM